MTNTNTSKIETVKSIAKICEIRNRKNLIRDLPEIEKKLLMLTMDLYGSIQALPGLDPRRLTSKKRYEVLCEGTAEACKIFHAFVNNGKYKGFTFSDQDVIETVCAWVSELNKWAEGNTLWMPMKRKVINFKKVVVGPQQRFETIDSFVLEVEDLQ